MFRSSLIASLVGTLVFAGAAAAQNSLPRSTDLRKGITQAQGSLIPIGPVAFKGNTEIVLVTPVRQPGQKANKKVIEKINIKNILDAVWNAQRNSADDDLRKFLADPKNTGGRRLENIRVALAQAGTRSRMTLKVDPGRKHFDVTYTVPANEIDFSVDVSFLPDPSLRVSFDLVVSASFDCKGTGQHNPLAVTKATVRPTNVRVRGDAIADVEDFVARLLSGSDPIVKLERGLTRSSVNITKELTTAVDRVDSAIRSAAPNTQMTPTFDRGSNTLVLTLTPRAPVLTQKTR